MHYTTLHFFPLLKVLEDIKGYSTPRKDKGEEGRKKGIKAHRVKPPTPTCTIDALIGDKEQKGKRGNKSKKQGVGRQPSYTRLFNCLLQSTCRICEEGLNSGFFLAGEDEGRKEERRRRKCE